MAEMTPAQFDVVAELLRSREPVRTAVRMVLLDASTAKEAAEATGLVHQSVTNALRRYRNAHAKLRVAYDTA
jgi:DNA-directed RNA polymerase specialized sigma24 family protein